jgi:hypothetical protein
MAGKQKILSRRITDGSKELKTETKEAMHAY